MSLAVTLYIITTLILFGLNTLANLAALAFSDKKQLPIATFIATLFAIALLIWGIAILVTN